LTVLQGRDETWIVGFQESLVDDAEVGVHKHLSLVVVEGGQLLLEKLLATPALLGGDGEHLASINLLKVFVPDWVRLRLIDYVFTERISSLRVVDDERNFKLGILRLRQNNFV